MASAVFFLTELGKPLLSRNYKGDVPMSAVDRFPELMARNPAPCFIDRGISYMYIRHSNIILLAVTRSPAANAMAIMHFLYRLVSVLESFVVNVEEESVIDNYVVLYELLDEMADFGHVQNTDPNLLQDYVTQTSYKLEVSTAISALTDKISWRPPGIWYRKNELFIDVRETLSTTIGADGIPVSCDLTGKIECKCFLSGMPNLKLGLNDRSEEDLKQMTKFRQTRYVQLTDIQMHQCVDLEKFEKSVESHPQHTIEFIPPDGKFDLLSYRVANSTLALRSLFKVEPLSIVQTETRITITCTVAAKFKKRQTCSYIEFRFPVPPDCDSPRCKYPTGSSVVYAPEHQAVIWRLNNFSGGRSASMKAELRVARPSSDDPEGSQLPMAAPVTVNFEMPGTIISGMSVRYLKIEEPQLKYQALPWVRYRTQSGEYEIRRSNLKSRSKPASELPNLTEPVQPAPDESAEHAPSYLSEPSGLSESSEQVGAEPGGPTKPTELSEPAGLAELPKPTDFTEDADLAEHTQSDANTSSIYMAGFTA